ncbi:reverse transcriptase domain-containing protein [Tanacetum coccineum]
MYIDGGASADILYEHCFQRLRPEVKRALHNSLDEFYGDQITIAIQWHYWKTRNITIAIKQILADFLIEKPETDAVLPQSEVKLQEPWILFTDGSSCVDGSGAVLILTNPEGMEFTYALCFEFTATNNEAEYEALIAGLRIAARMGVRNLEANVDSRLVANHVLGDTPFSLVYGTEAVIPAEIGMPTIRTAEVNITTNDDERRIDLDILEERREQAAMREEKAKLKMKGYYDVNHFTCLL